MQTELESGWFAIQIEPDDKDDYGIKNLTKVCATTQIIIYLDSFFTMVRPPYGLLFGHLPSNNKNIPLVSKRAAMLKPASEGQSLQCYPQNNDRRRSLQTEQTF